MAAEISAPVRRFLDKAHVAVLATRSPQGIQASPVWFLHTNGHILINTAKGRAKLRNMHARPEVALVVVNPESGGKDIDRLSQRYTGKPYAYPGGDHPKNRVSIRIQPTRVTAMGL